MKPQIADHENARELDFAAALSRHVAGTKKAERTRAGIQAATCRLLHSLPPGALKVADICREAGIAHGTFYIYFSDVRHVASDVLVAFVDFVQAAMRQAAKGRDADRVRATTAAYCDLFEHNPGLMRCLVSSFDDFPEAMQAFQKLNREWTRTVADAVQRRQAHTGASPPVSREELLRRAYALGGMIDQYLITLLFSRDPALAAVSADREAVIDTLTDIWKRGMGE